MVSHLMDREEIRVYTTSSPSGAMFLYEAVRVRKVDGEDWVRHVGFGTNKEAFIDDVDTSLVEVVVYVPKAGGGYEEYRRYTWEEEGVYWCAYRNYLKEMCRLHQGGEVAG